jgi:hypothetical protein
VGTAKHVQKRLNGPNCSQFSLTLEKRPKVTRGPSKLRQRELARALRAAKAAGVPVDIHVNAKSGDLVIKMRDENVTATNASHNEWDTPLAGEAKQ